MKNFARPLLAVSAFLVIAACGGGGGLVGGPDIPTGLTAIAGDASALLAWNPSNGATHYNVKRSTDVAGPFVVVSGPNVPSFNDTGLTNGVRYYYVVSADGPLGESGNSNVVSVVPQAVQ